MIRFTKTVSIICGKSPVSHFERQPISRVKEKKMELKDRDKRKINEKKKKHWISWIKTSVHMQQNFLSYM